jgi:TRAP transporter 4TM/12TM fusion protein
MIVKHALIPAILYFAGIFFVVDLEASRLNLKGLEKKDMPEWKSKVLTYGHMTIPLVVLVYLLIIGRTPNFAVTRSIAAMFLLSFLRRETRLNLGKLVAGTRVAAKGLVLVGTACAAAGIIIGVVALTGVSVKFSYIVVMLSRESYLLALFLTMIAAIILGMGMPTSAAYVLMASMLIPALIRLDIGLIQAHLFGFYFACMALVTPPVAVTSYACAGLAGADFNKTGWTALRMAVSAFVVPYFFIFSPELLLIGKPVDTVIAVLTALLGIYSMSVALQGFWGMKLSIWLRAVILPLSLLLIYPGVYTDAIAVVLLVLIAVIVHRRNRRKHKSADSYAAKDALNERDL